MASKGEKRINFTAAGEPKYYDNQTYPIDIHAPAQLVITLVRLGRLREHQELVFIAGGSCVEFPIWDDASHAGIVSVP